MPALDRKLELMCHPISMFVGGLIWQYINAIHEPEGYGGSFVAMAMGNSNVEGFIRVVSINDKWLWSVYVGGVVLSDCGETSDLFLSMKAGCSHLRATLSSLPSNDHDVSGVVPSGLEAIGIAAQSWA